MDKNALHANNVEHRDVHNLYAQVMHRATWEGLILRDVNEEVRPRPFLLTRGFFVGSQRYGAVWTGDNKAGVLMMKVFLSFFLFKLRGYI